MLQTTEQMIVTNEEKFAANGMRAVAASATDMRQHTKSGSLDAGLEQTASIAKRASILLYGNQLCLCGPRHILLCVWMGWKSPGTCYHRLGASRTHRTGISGECSAARAVRDSTLCNGPARFQAVVDANRSPARRAEHLRSVLQSGLAPHVLAVAANGRCGLVGTESDR